MARSAVCWALAAAILWPAPAAAWNSTGHMVSAIMAWRRMAPAQQERAVAILKAAFEVPAELPRFKADLTTGMPMGLTPNKQDMWLFARASVWPDLLRDKAHPAGMKFHKGPWHYYDFPYVAPGDATPLPAPLPVAAENEEPKDAISALRRCVRDVKAADTSPGDRAARLCFLLHVGADIHQPLHCVAMFAADGLPKGDQGGNLQLVRRTPRGKPMTLHAVWDDLIGPPELGFDILEQIATSIERNANFGDEALAANLLKRDFAEWVKEGTEAAGTSAYLDGKLKTYRGINSRDFEAQGLKAALVPPLPDDYVRKSRPAAQRGLALASRRLVQLLEQATPQPAP